MVVQLRYKHAQRCRLPLAAVCATLGLMLGVVRDNAALSRFELDEGGVMAVANYKLGDGVITFTHTEVPLKARGGGIASRLIEGALTAVRARGLKVEPRCWFVRGYIARHPEFRDLLA